MAKISKPKYMEIYDHFREMIRSGILHPDSKLPSEGSIAETFGVSRITVTRAMKQLQDERYINRIQGSGSYVRKVEKKADGLKIVSLIMSFLGLGREIQIIQAIETKLKGNGYLLTVHNSHEDPVLEQELILEMKGKAAGMIIYPTSSVDNNRLFENLMKEQWPLVYIDRYPNSIPCSFVCSDNFDGAYQLGRYFLEAGHRQIALIYHDIVGLTSERDRFNGFMHAMDEGMIPRDNIRIVSINRIETEETIQRILKELYTTGKDKNRHPSALFTFNDALAQVTMQCLSRQNEFQLPENFILAGFDDLKQLPRSVPFITIHQNYQAIGEEAVKILLEVMEKNTLVKRQVVVPVHLIHYTR